MRFGPPGQRDATGSNFVLVAGVVVVASVGQPIGFDGCGASVVVVDVAAVVVVIDDVVVANVAQHSVGGLHWLRRGCGSGGPPHWLGSGPSSDRCLVISR